MARNLPWKFFRKFGYTSRGCPLFRKFWEMLFLSPLEFAENSNRTVCLNGKRPEFAFFDYEVFATVLRNECYFARSTGQIIANILSSPSDNRLLAFGKVHWRVNSRFLQVATEFSRAYHPSDVSALSDWNFPEVTGFVASHADIFKTLSRVPHVVGMGSLMVITFFACVADA